MRTISGYVETDKVGSRCEFTFDVEDDATDEEIEDRAREEMFNTIEWGWTEEVRS